MAKFRARQDMQPYLSTMQSLLEVRSSAAYQEGSPDAVHAAASVEFMGEVAIHRLAGSARVPRGMRAALHSAAVAVHEQQQDMEHYHAGQS